MHRRPRYRYRTAIVLLACVGTQGCGGWFYMGQHPSVTFDAGEDYLTEDTRRTLRAVRITVDTAKPTLTVGGDYGAPTTSLSEAAAAGAAEGISDSAGVLSEDPRALVLYPIVMPAAMIAGSIAGASAAAFEKKLAEFREELADELVTSSDTPTPGVGLAQALTVMIPQRTDVQVTKDADTELVISIRDISVDTADRDAVITTVADITLTRLADSKVLYRRSKRYAERNSLRAWSADDYALYQGYPERARRYVAAQVVADVFERLHVRHVLRPAGSESFTGGWAGRFRGGDTTLAWEYFLVGGDDHAPKLDEDSIQFDLRILEADRIVYEANRIDGDTHTVRDVLPECTTLRWSVRPTFLVDGQRRAGAWMHYRSNFDKIWNSEFDGPMAETPPHWQYFARLTPPCTTQ
ncbi:MAG: hypothetical protein AAF350_05200 [Pseudomonadota bacterium]